MNEVIETTNQRIEQVIKKLRDIQEEINKTKIREDKNLREKGFRNYSEEEETAFREIQEEIVNIEYNLSGTEIYEMLQWRKMNITE